ncbi:MAG: ABC transporter ATP-binding protein [Candidatus Izemoplasmatales bacterium]
MKALLFENKRKFIQYIIACFLPVIGDMGRVVVFAMIFEAIERKSMEFFQWTILAVIGLILLDAAAFIASRMMRISYMRDTLYSLRIKAFEKIMWMDYQQFHQKSRDVYLSNLINDINTFEQSFFLSLINVIFRFGIYTVCMTLLFILMWQVALAVMIASFLVLLISQLFQKRTVKLQQEVSNENERTTLNVSNTLSGLEILKLNNIEKTFLKNTQRQIDKLEGRKFSFRFFSTLQIDLNVAIGYFLFIALLIYLMTLIGTGMSYGNIAMIIQLSTLAIFPLVNMLPLINVIKSSSAIYDKIAKPEEMAEGNSKSKEFVFKKRVEVQDLHFQYDERTLFHDLDFTIEKGKKYLLKGPSGSGKSTLIKLLSGIYDQYDGKITVDGTDLRAISLKSLNNRSSYIFQDVFLFEASLKDNIALFKEIDPYRLAEAIEKSGLKEFVDSHPKGVDFQIEENGKNLSGGERQRVSIARALYKQAEVLFVDEATSSLNDELGRGIEATILNLDATVIAISHKLFAGITNRYDYVLEIKDGFINQYPIQDYYQEAS